MAQDDRSRRHDSDRQSESRSTQSEATKKEENRNVATSGGAAGTPDNEFGQRSGKKAPTEG